MHSKALTSHMGLLDRNRKRSKPMEICTAFPESGAGLSKSIYALKHTKLMFVYRSPIFQYWGWAFVFQCSSKLLHPGRGWHVLVSGCLGQWAQWPLTEGGSVETGNCAGHKEVCDLPESQQASGVVPLPLLLLDQALQFLLESLRKIGKDKRLRGDTSQLRT